MSSLDEDLKEAQRLGYGVWYGRYKADHPGVPRAVPVEVEEQPDAVCAICGKHFYRNRGNKKYCGGACNEEANRRRTAAKQRQKRPEMLPRICPHCGKEFQPWHRGVRFCCKQCQMAAWYKRKKNTQEETT